MFGWLTHIGLLNLSLSQPRLRRWNSLVPVDVVSPSSGHHKQFYQDGNFNFAFGSPCLQTETRPPIEILFSVKQQKITVKKTSMRWAERKDRFSTVSSFIIISYFYFKMKPSGTLFPRWEESKNRVQIVLGHAGGHYRLWIHMLLAKSPSSVAYHQSTQMFGEMGLFSQRWVLVACFFHFSGILLSVES